MADKDNHACDVCGGDMPVEYEPLFCCNGFDCACRGLPTNQPVCSEKCWDELKNRGRK